MQVPMDTTKSLLIQEIRQANTVEELNTLTDRVQEFMNDRDVLKAAWDKQQQLLSNLSAENMKLKRNVSTFVTSDGKELSDVNLCNQVKKQIPPNSYLHVKVNTLASYQFCNSLQKARQIELIREEWGWVNIPILDSIAAGFKTAAHGTSKDDILNSNLLMDGILAASVIAGDEENGIKPDLAKQSDFKKQMVSAYWQGKRITIIVPFDFSENGVISINSDSQLLTFAIDTGQFFHHLFFGK